ncbi:hypothetical protein NW066_05115 [Mycoplasmopsis felis]|uniref:M13-type metalloendopeptidase n=1 Tax=Mycoplasmopsis felis TaxID=33923 RepID=UPI0021AF9A59|nr:M13-type metalloendopeptidase [Mycoplasmopsis felis]UWV84912.1 hypothetical protein NW066_05115 [Mycoplasmopsis felis]
MEKARRSVYKEGTAKRLLDSDVHAPAKIRANIVAANMDEFQDFFKITENDNIHKTIKTCKDMIKDTIKYLLFMFLKLNVDIL